MQFQAGATIVTADGDHVGKIDRVVMDPRTKTVTHLVVRRGWLFKTDKVLPVDSIARTADDRVVLRADAGDLDQLPDFEEKQYILVDEQEMVRQAEAAGGPPVPVASAAPAMLWYPPVPAGEGNVEPGLGRSPGKPRYTRTIEQNIPEDTVALKEGAKVMSADGQHVGDIQEVFVSSETKKATHFLITHGLLLKTQRMIPIHWVQMVTEDQADLAVSARLVQGLPEYHA
jgi:uncharacterized protein YrrD